MSKQKLRWWQMRLSTLLLCLTAAAVGSSWVSSRYRRSRTQQCIIDEIERRGGVVGVRWDPITPEVADSARLTGSEWNDEDVALVAKLTNLQDLALYDSNVTDAGVAQLRRLSRLEYLHLGGRQITDHGLQHLCSLRYLKVLHLSDTKVSDNGLKHLLELHALERVFLQGTNVSATGVENFKEQMGPECVVSGVY